MKTSRLLALLCTYAASLHVVACSVHCWGANTQLIGRRAAVGGALAAAAVPQLGWASDTVIARGTVRVQEGLIPPDAAALYVTVRVVPSSNVGLYVTAGVCSELACLIDLARRANLIDL
jgi:hypothetical protein